MNVTVAQDILCAMVKEFAKELNVSDFANSNGWLQRFKIRHSIGHHVCVISGQSAEVDRELMHPDKCLSTNDARKSKTGLQLHCVLMPMDLRSLSH